MPSLVIRHKVADDATWKPLFDAHGVARRVNGSRGSRIVRNAADQNEVLTLFGWDELCRTRLVAPFDDRRKAKERAGVVDEPDLWCFEETGGENRVDRQPYLREDSQMPSMTTPMIRSLQ